MIPKLRYSVLPTSVDHWYRYTSSKIWYQKAYNIYLRSIWYSKRKEKSKLKLKIILLKDLLGIQYWYSKSIIPSNYHVCTLYCLHKQCRLFYFWSQNRCLSYFSLTVCYAESSMYLSMNKEWPNWIWNALKIWNSEVSQNIPKNFQLSMKFWFHVVIGN